MQKKVAGRFSFFFSFLNAYKTKTYKPSHLHTRISVLSVTLKIFTCFDLHSAKSPTITCILFRGKRHCPDEPLITRTREKLTMELTIELPMWVIKFKSTFRNIVIVSPFDIVN